MVFDSFYLLQKCLRSCERQAESEQNCFSYFPLMIMFSRESGKEEKDKKEKAMSKWPRMEYSNFYEKILGVARSLFLRLICPSQLGSTLGARPPRRAVSPPV